MIFTPRLSADTQDRDAMDLSPADMQKIGRGGPWRATVTDQNTGRRWRVRGAACSLPRCLCDAVILGEVKDSQP